MKYSSRSFNSAGGWLAALANPNHRMEIDFHGAPAFYTAKQGWINEPRPFGQHLLYFVVSGSFRVSRGEREYEVGRGTLLWIPPWTSFRCWLPGRRPVSFYRFRLRVLGTEGVTLDRRGAPLLVEGIEPVRRWFEEIVRASGAGGRSLRPWRQRAALLGLFAEAQGARAEPVPRGRLLYRQRDELEKLLHRDGRVQVTPAQLAARLGLSADYFARLFRRTYGISPRAWIVRERIKMAAARLLESHLNIGEVALEFGYRDIFFFSTQFKQVMGQSPRNFRRVESR